MRSVSVSIVRETQEQRNGPPIPCLDGIFAPEFTRTWRRTITPEGLELHVVDMELVRATAAVHHVPLLDIAQHIAQPHARDIRHVQVRKR